MRTWPVLALAACLLSCASCSTSSPPPAAPAVVSDDPAPGRAVEEFYRRLNGGDYDTAMELYSAQARQTLDDVGAGGAGLATWAQDETKHGSVSRVDVIRSDVRGSNATVEFDVSYRDGSSKRAKVELIQETGPGSSA